MLFAFYQPPPIGPRAAATAARAAGAISEIDEWMEEAGIRDVSKPSPTQKTPGAESASERERR